MEIMEPDTELATRMGMRDQRMVTGMVDLVTAEVTLIQVARSPMAHRPAQVDPTALAKEVVRL